MVKPSSRCLFLACAIGYSVSTYAANGTGTSLGYYNILPPLKPINISRELEQTSGPVNELGFDQNEAYVSDLKQYWSFSSLHYYRFTSYGIFGGRVNYANRYGIAGEQYQVEAYPKILPEKLPGSYVTLTFGWSNTSQRVFPRYQYNVEPYLLLPNGYEVAIGQRYLKSFDVNIYTYTGVIGKTINDNFIWFRPYHYTPKSTDFFEFGVRHFFETPKTSLAIKAGIGKTPDIGDVPPLNQIIVLQTKSVSIDGQLPLNKCVLLKGELGYMKQVYQSGNVRHLSNASVGVNWQF